MQREWSELREGRSKESRGRETGVSEGSPRRAGGHVGGVRVYLKEGVWGLVWIWGAVLTETLKVLGRGRING